MLTQASAAGVAAALLVDGVSSLFYRTETVAEVNTIGPRQGPPRRAIVILPGYLMSGHLVAEAFAPYVEDNDAFVTVDYAERGVDIDALYQQISKALRALNPDEVRLYGASMGGLVAAGLIEHYKREGQPFGRLVLVLDTAPGQESDLKRPGWMFTLSCIYSGGIISSAAWRFVSRLVRRPVNEPDADPTLIRRARNEGASVGAPAVTSQACFIRRSAPLRANQLVGAVDRVVYLRGAPATHDPLVRVDKSIEHWQVAFPNLSVVVLPGRESRWHLPIVERPRETVLALVNQ